MTEETAKGNKVGDEEGEEDLGGGGMRRCKEDGMGS
jgi:hypothetical protein